MTTKKLIKLVNEWWAENDESLEMTINEYKTRTASDWSSSMDMCFYSEGEIEYFFGDLTKCNGLLEIIAPFGTFRV